jgi:hypothetical protein
MGSAGLATWLEGSGQTRLCFGIDGLATTWYVLWDQAIDVECMVSEVFLLL